MGLAKRVLRKYQSYLVNSVKMDYWKKIHVRVNKIYGVDILNEALNRAKEGKIIAFKIDMTLER